MTQEGKIVLGVGLASLLLIFGAVFLLSKPGTTPPVSDPGKLVRSDSHTTGSINAKVTIVEFGDYQCPACGVAHPEVKKILSEYNGKVSFVFRNFPLPMHINADIAAEAAEAAGAQGKFWEMHDMLYEKQAEWSEKSDARIIFSGYAKSLGLDTKKFEEAITKNAFQSTIQKDIEDGNTLGVNSTPTFYVNGVKAENIYDVRTKIAAELGK